MGDLTTDLDLLTGFVDAPRAETLETLRRRLADGRVRVLLLGEAKRGKSTLGNALVGRPVLPAGLLPLTSVSTTLRLCPPGVLEHAEVQFQDGRVARVDLDEIAAFVTEEANPGNTKDVVAVTGFLTAPEHGGPPDDGGTDSPAGNPRSPGSLLGLGVDLVDTPGEGSVWEHNTSTARAAQEQMDLAVVVLSADPPVSTAERDLIARAAERAATTYVVLNKTDRLDDAERGEVTRFTRTVLGPVLGCPAEQVPLLECSALAGLRARLGEDEIGWQTSGVAGLAASLRARVRESGLRDVRTSVRMAAARLTRDLLDEQQLRARTLELASQRRDSVLTGFAAALQEMDAQHAEARALVTARVTTLQRALDADAAGTADRLRQRAVASMQELCAGAPELSADELLERGQDRLATLLQVEVGGWLDRWAQRVDDELASVLAREQRLIEAALADLRGAARELLDLDLDVDAEPVRLPERSGFRLDLAPEIGWRAPLSETISRHAPARLARGRTCRHLTEQAADLADKHVGRARADLQGRLSRAHDDLQAQVRDAITERTRRLLAALAEARAEPDPQTRLRTETRRAEDLAALLARLSAPGRTPEAATTGPKAAATRHG